MTDQPNPAPQAAEPTAPAPEADVSSFSFADLLQREEVQALEAVKAAGLSMDGAASLPADTAPAADTAPPAAAGTEQAPQPADSLQGEAQPPGQRPPEAVPYQRFAEVNRQRQEAAAREQQAAQRIAYLEGLLAAGRAPQPAQQQPTQPPVDPVRVIDQQIADLDQKYEKSDIPWAEYRRQQSVLADRRTELLVQRAVQQAAPRQQQPAQPAPPPSPRTSVALQQSVDQIKAAEPWVAKVPRDILEAPSIQARVDQLAQAARRNVDPRTEAGWLNRAIFTVLAAKEMGLDRAYGGGAPAPAQPPAQQPQGNGQAQQQQTPTLPAQVKQPPAIGTMGVGAPAPIPGGYTAEQIAAMPMEDVMKLPDEVKDHFAREKV